MTFKKDTFNDMQLFEDASEMRLLDCSDKIEQQKEVTLANKNSPVEMNDIITKRPEDLETLDCTDDKIIRIRRKKRGITSEDITRPERSGFPILSPLRKYKKFRARTVSIIEPLGRLHPESLDIRDLEYIPRQKHPDIYLSHASIRGNLMRFGKKHRKAFFHVGKRSAKIGIIFGIVAISTMLFAVGLKTYIQSSTTEQYQRLFALKTLRDPVLIQEQSEKIRAQFARLGIIFAPIDLFFNNSIYSNDSVLLAHNVIYGGKEIADMTALLGNLGQSASEFAATSRPTIQTWDAGIFGKFSQLKVTDFLRENEDVLMTFQEHLDKAVHYYGQIKSLGDPTIDEKFDKAFEMLYNAQKYTKFLLDNFDDVLYALGDTKPQRYVILNQNRDEIRATGGFPGSVITVELYKGAVQKYDKKDVYYYDWHLYPYKELPPEGLNRISENYGLRDANYYPEFSKSLDKINFFYEKAGGGSIDTLIAINQWVIIDLLAKYGGVRLKEINTDVTAENFSVLMSTLVENKLNARISPKDILFRFSEELEKHLLDKKDIVGYIDIFTKALADNEILIGSRDETIQKFITTHTDQESWKTSRGNWIYPIFTSLSGNKSDRYMKRTFETESLALSGCVVQNTVHLSSELPFGKKEESEIADIFSKAGITDAAERERLMQIEWNSENRQFVRVVVPKNATMNSKDTEKNLLLDVSNPNYSVISFYLNTPVRQTNSITFSYTVPVPDCSSNLEFIKQPWLTHYEFRPSSK